MAYVIGIDASTTATKAVLIDETGVVRGVGVTEYGYEVPRPLWSEQSPELWWDGAIASIRSVLAETGVDGADVVAVGLTGQMHGLVLLDEADRVLRPAILWNDQRTAAECDAIRAAVGPQRLIEITGNDALTGFTAPKLVWVRDHEPDVWARVAHVLLPKDYVRLRLTGEHALDKADGAGTILFDLAARDWSPEVLAALAIDPAWMPPTFEGPQVTGTVTADAADADRAAGRDAGRGRRRRPGRQRGRVSGSWIRGSMALSLGTSGRRVRGHGPADPRAARHRPRVLPRRAGPLAPDVGDALGRGQPALVPRRARAGRGLRGARGRGGGGRPGERRPAVPPLPHRGAEPTSGPARPRRVRRAHRDPRPAAPDAGRPGGRGLRPA